MKRISLDIQVTGDQAILWQDEALFLLDQRALPRQELFVRCDTVVEAAEAITDMVVRGAPAIGVTAAYAMVLAGRQAYVERRSEWKNIVGQQATILAAARPTAVNLRWALDRMLLAVRDIEGSDPTEKLLQQAKRIHREDVLANRRMGEWGADLFATPTAVITHCNAGALATGGYGTALGVIKSAYGRGMVERVFADETRPWLQGSRLTAWELEREGIPVSLLVDGAAAALLASGGIDWVVVGSDRIAANGDVANKIGTYGLVLAAKHHGVKVMVAAPTSTVDMSAPSGKRIPIETRGEEEIFHCAGKMVAAPGVQAWNPVFDITPAELVDAIVTERGVIRSPTEEKMIEHMKQSS